jgi:FATC domain
MQGETSRTSAKQSESLIESEADRALQLVKRKLSSRLSPEADVRRLILEATDEGNLSRMYSGSYPGEDMCLLTFRLGTLRMRQWNGK